MGVPYLAANIAAPSSPFLQGAALSLGGLGVNVLTYTETTRVPRHHQDPLRARGVLGTRQSSCDLGQVICDLDWCIPSDSVCCGDGNGAWCESGWICIDNTDFCELPAEDPPPEEEEPVGCDSGEVECGPGCMPDGASCCDDIQSLYCDPGYTCEADGCLAEPTCDDGEVECGPGCMPDGGSCCDDVASLYCDPGFTCGDGECVAEDPCEDGEVLCGPGCIPSNSECCDEVDGWWCDPGWSCSSNMMCDPPEDESEDPTTSAAAPDPTTSEEPDPTTSEEAESTTTEDESTTTEEPSASGTEDLTTDDPTASGPTPTDDDNLDINDVTEAPSVVIQTAVPTDAQDDAESACFLYTEFTSFYTTPDWYSDMPSEAQSYYSSLNVAERRTQDCTATAVVDDSDDDDSGGAALSPGATAGAVVGGVAGAAAIGGLIFWLIKTGALAGTKGAVAGAGAAGGAGAALGPTGGESSMAAGNTAPGAWNGVSGAEGQGWNGVSGAENQGWNGVSGTEGQGWNGVSGGPGAGGAPPMGQVPIPPVVVAGAYRRGDEDEHQHLNRPEQWRSPTTSSGGSFGYPRRNVGSPSPASPGSGSMGWNAHHSMRSEADGQQISEVHGQESWRQLDGQQVYEAPAHYPENYGQNYAQPGNAGNATYNQGHGGQYQPYRG